MPGIGRWTYETAAKQIQAWNRANRKVQVSLNASVKQLQDPDFFAHLYDTLRLNDVSPEQVKLEVTESIALDDVGVAKDILTRVRRIGVRTVLDDFGTDYSSLTYLQKLPIDEIKIDMSFVRNLPDSEHDAAIVRGVIALGHDLNRTIVAEGVETVEQLEWLRKAHCDVIQGYLVERPMPARQFERWRDVQVPYALAG
jgi:EAL domain-containing protein (putative c-di-GMP-specific phosphodiesterase class I)